MNFFKWLFRIKGDTNNPITEEMREKSIEMRRMNAKINQLERQLEMKQHLAGLQHMVENFGDDNGSDKSMEKLLIPLLFNAFSKPPQDNRGFLYGESIQPSAVTNPEKNTLIASELKKRLPKEYAEQIKNLSDGDLLDIRQKIIM